MPPSRKESRRQRRTTRRRVRPLRLALTLGGGLFVALMAFAAVVVARTNATLPPVTHIPPVAAGAILYDRNGQEITQLHSVTDAIPVPLSQIPVNLRNAVIATEDASFYTNPGFDLKGILRAALYDLTGHGNLQGASTISEQLGKMLFLHDNGTVSYKVKEVLLGISLDHTYTKDQILDMYLNRVYLGEGAVGVGAASEIYFHKPVSQLDLAQCALLGGLPQAPSYYDPLVNPKAALARRNEVLQRMAAVGDISPALAAQTERLPLELAPGASPAFTYPDPWFVDAVIGYLEGRGFTSNQLFSGDLRIYTTLDPKVQNAADQAVAAVMGRLRTPPAGPQAAVVMMQPSTGDVLAIVGGREHPPGYQTVENLAVQGRFQTGSAIKPLAEYTDAIEHRDTPFTIIEDAPFLKRNGKWWPQNDNFVYQGAIPLEYALAISDNNASVRLALSGRVGIASAWQTAVHQFGLPLSPADRDNTALAIGGETVGVSPLEMADAYATFANNGVRPTARLVRAVVSPDGHVLYRDPVRAVPRLTPQVDYVMTKIMEQVITHPGATAYGVADIGRPAAGKTGTSSQNEEDWFCGYTPQLVGCVWEGYPTPTPQPGIFGATYAAPIWRDTMVASLRGVPVQHFVRPPGIVAVRVDTKSGLLPSPLTPPSDIATGYYIAGTQPTRISDAWVVKTVVRGDAHELWTPGCPLPPTRQVFLRRPTDLVPGAPLPADHVLWPPTLVCGHGGASPNQPVPGPSPQAVTLTVRGGLPVPSQLTVAADVPVQLTVVNQDPAPYVFEDPDLGLDVTLLPSQATTFTFTATQAGTDPFQLVGGQGGGAIVVEPSPGQGGVNQGGTPPTAPPAPASPTVGPAF
ncbi:MAG: transglycosylase domain-containing protein [Firmicutes bacterium]|nr:transglycosylase domain-containing protein [Bacillota bacterium]